MKKTQKIFWISLGTISLILGFIGIFLPILPTTPFLLLTSFAYSKGSEKFHSWFTSTKLYQKYLEPFERNKAMTLKGKLSIVIPVSALLILTAILLKKWYLRLLIICILLLKYYYFAFKINTIKSVEAGKKSPCV